MHPFVIYHWFVLAIFFLLFKIDNLGMYRYLILRNRENLIKLSLKAYCAVSNCKTTQWLVKTLKHSNVPDSITARQESPTNCFTSCSVLKWICKRKQHNITLIENRWGLRAMLSKSVSCFLCCLYYLWTSNSR